MATHGFGYVSARRVRSGRLALGSVVLFLPVERAPGIDSCWFGRLASPVERAPGPSSLSFFFTHSGILTRARSGSRVLFLV